MPRSVLWRWSAVVAVHLIAVVVTVVAADVYLRSRGHEPYRRTFPGHARTAGGVPWARADPMLGWTIEPSFLPHQINPQGFRDTKDLEHSPRRAGVTRIMLLGDSFVVGANLPTEQALPALLQSRLGAASEVFPLAAPGWGVDQMFLAFQHYRKILDPDVVVLAFIDDDVRRMLDAYRSAERLTKPVLTVSGGLVIRQDAAAPGTMRAYRWLGESVFLSLLAREYALATDASGLAAAIFTAIGADMARARGRTVVMRIPTRDDSDRVNRLRRSLSRFESRLAGTAAEYLDLQTSSEAMGLTWPPTLYVEDGHLSGEGAQQVVRVLAAHLARTGTHTRPGGSAPSARSRR